jgi:enterochelin esterase family protein
VSHRLKNHSIVFLITLCASSALCGQEAARVAKPLRLDQTIKGTLRPGDSEGFSVSLAAGDYMQAVIDQLDGWIDVTVYDPTGERVKTVSANPISAQQRGMIRVETSELENVDVIALRDGQYRIEVRAVGGPKPIVYTISYNEHKRAAERILPPVFHADRSPQIAALEKGLKQGNREALATFWERVKQQGSPLVEPIEDDPKHMLVTVLWHDAYGVQNVALHWEPYADLNPEKYAFTRLLDTDLWYLTIQLPSNARFVYQVSPDDDLIPYDRFSPFDANARERHEASSMADPLNPHHWIQQNGDFSVAELPGIPPQPWTEKRADVPAGTLEKTRFKSASLKNEREIAVYTPPGYSQSHAPYWLAVVFDEPAYIGFVPTPTILDNLIAAHKIPPMVAVFVDAIDRDTRRTETTGPLAMVYADAMSTELISWIRQNYNVTTDPAHTIAGGSSANGFASVLMAYRHPDVYGNVLCQSGAFSWEPGTGPGTGKMPGDNPEWLAQHFASEPKKPIRFFVEAGLFENTRLGILDSSRHFRDVAIAKGYDIHYQEFAGGHSYINWRGSMADGLIYLANPSALTGAKKP